MKLGTDHTVEGIDARLNDPMETDEDNNFQLVNNENGTVSGRILLDTNGDLIGDEPAVDFFFGYLFIY